MITRTVMITDADVRFVALAMSHYKTFAEAAERQGEQDQGAARTAGIMRAQEFYARQFLSRIAPPKES